MIIDGVSGKLCMWAVYERPSDFPDHCVARAFIIDREPIPTPRVLFADTLDELRDILNYLYPDLICFPRSPGDEPQIIETWL